MNGPSSAVGAALAARLRLRGRTATPKCTDQRAAPVQFLTGVPVLDREDSLSDHGTRIAPDGLSDGSLVDIVGFSGSGKTALLHHISAHIIAPSLVTGDKVLAGREAGVIWIDLNGGFDCEILAKYIRTLCPTDVDVEELVDESLQRVHLYRPHSSISLLSTLHSLRDFIASPLGMNVRALVIDAMGMHHHCDAVRAETGSLRDDSAGDDMEQALVSVLRKLLRDTHLTCFVSKCALFEGVPFNGPWPFDARFRPFVPQEFLPATWTSLVGRTLVVCHAPPVRYVVFLAKSPDESIKPSQILSGMVQFNISESGLRFRKLERTPG